MCRVVGQGVWTRLVTPEPDMPCRERDYMEVQLRTQTARINLLEEAVNDGQLKADQTHAELQSLQLEHAEQVAELQQVQVGRQGG